MKLYRFGVRMLSGSRSPVHSDTLFGSVCWALLYLEGEDRLKSLLQSCIERKPAFIFSDGFPRGFLPRPAGGNYTTEFSESRSKSEIIEFMKTAKKVKKISYIPLDDMSRIFKGEKISLGDCRQPDEAIVHMTAHNTIDRETGTSMKGGLYREIYRWDGDIDIYALVAEEWVPSLKECLKVVSSWGYGGGASRGRGAFQLEDEYNVMSEVNFDIPENPNAFMTLSRCIPTQDMPVRCQYRLDVKLGRFGKERGKAGYPFKRPLLMLEPGAVFWGDPPECGWCGTMAGDLSDEYNDALQCGMSIILPCKIEPPEWGA